MSFVAWYGIQRAFHDAFRTLVPLPHDRAPWSWSNVHWGFLPYVPLGLMAYLVRRGDTFVMRLFLMPIAICLTVYSTHAFCSPEPKLGGCNWGQSFTCVQLVAKALEYGLTPNGRFKVGETKLKPIGGGTDPDPPSSPSTKLKASDPSFLPPAVSDAFEVFYAHRGYGWDFGQGVHKPREYRPLERGAFLKATLKMFLEYFLLLDFLESCLRTIPGLCSPHGTSIFLPLPPVQRYLTSTVIHLVTGTMSMTTFNTGYALATLVGVGLLRQSPLQWPPLYDHPFSSDSLSVFWAKSWHQLLRQTFMILGGYPAFWLGSWISEGTAKLLMLFGVFAASGLIHEYAIYASGGGFDGRIMLFYMVQSVGVLAERIWYRVTGKKVSGWAGLVWTYFFVAIVGQIYIDALYQHGLSGMALIPEAISPTRKLLWPVLRSIHPVFGFLP